MVDDQPAAYEEVAVAYSRAIDPDGVGLVDPVLTELVGDVTRRDVLSLACGQLIRLAQLPVSRAAGA